MEQITPEKQQQSTQFKRNVILDGAWTPGGQIFVGKPSSVERKRFFAQIDSVDAPHSNKSILQQVISSSTGSTLTGSIPRIRQNKTTPTPTRIPIIARNSSNKTNLPHSNEENKPLIANRDFPVVLNRESLKDVDLEQKQKLLESLRAKKHLLAHKLMKTSSTSTTRVKGEDCSETVKGSPTSPPRTRRQSSIQSAAKVAANNNCSDSATSRTAIDLPSTETTSDPVVTKPPKQELQPANVVTDTASVILQHLNKLSSRELDKLTVINTNANKKPSRPMIIREILKNEAPPESPNSKTLSKFASTSKSIDLQDQKAFSLVVDDQSKDNHYGKRVGWKQEIAKTQQMATTRRLSKSRSLVPKSCLRSRKSDSDNIPVVTESPASPVIIQRFIYKPIPATKATSRSTNSASTPASTKKPAVKATPAKPAPSTTCKTANYRRTSKTGLALRANRTSGGGKRELKQ